MKVLIELDVDVTDIDDDDVNDAMKKEISDVFTDDMLIEGTELISEDDLSFVVNEAKVTFP